MAFQSKLKELMNAKNMKAADLARSTALSEAAISDYLNGKKEPRGRQSVAIAKALGVSLDTLWETDFDNSTNGTSSDIPSELLDKYSGPNQPDRYIAAYGGGIVSAENAKEIEDLILDLKDQLVKQIYACELNVAQLRQLQDIIRALERY